MAGIAKGYAMSKKIEQDEVATNEPKEKIRVLFTNTYIGELGVYYKNNYYFLDEELAEKLKDDTVAEK
jgi:hypothetical protein